MRDVPAPAVISGLAGLTGAMMIAINFGPHDAHMERLGVLAVLVSTIAFATSRVTAQLRAVHKEADAAFEAGFEMGMDKGYLEGRRVGSPVVVSLSDRRASESTSHAERAFPLGGLGQARN